MKFKSLFEESMRKNKGAYLMTFLFFSVGIVLGAYTIKYMGDFNRSELSNYFTSFSTNLGSENINHGDILFSSIKNNGILFIAIILLGIFIFGFPFILLIDLWKGYSIGFTFSFLLTTYEYKGIGLALAAIIPQNIFIIPCLILLSTICFSMSFDKFKSKFTKNKKISIDIAEFGNILIIFSILLGIGIFIEAFISPSIIRFIITTIYL